MNEFLKKAAEIFGFSSERVATMTAEETKKLEGYGEAAAALEAENAAAISAKEEAEAKVIALEADLSAVNATIETANATIEEHAATITSQATRITALEAEATAAAAEITELKSQLPGADSTVVIKTGSEAIPGGEKPKPKRSWER